MTKQTKEQLQIIWLRAFVLTAEYRKFTSVAATLGCDQTGVRRYLDSLENWLGRGLVGKEVPPKLTSAGQQFLPVVKQVLQLLDQAKDELQSAPLPVADDSASPDLRIIYIEVPSDS